MKKIYASVFAALLLLLGLSKNVNAQCNLSTSTMYATSAAPTDCSPVSITTSAYCAEPVSVTGLVAGNTYLFTVSNSTSTQYPNYTFNLYSGTTSGTAPVSFVSGTTAPTTAAPLTITYTPATSGTMSMQLFDIGCTASGSGHGLNSFTVQCMSCGAPLGVTSQPSSGTVLQGALNAQVVRVGIPVCASGNVSSITFGTTGSTSPSTDILNAKVYYTTTTTFSATTQFGTTVLNPNGSFTVTGSQAIPASSTGYFWLTYDIACNAVTANVVDAEVTSYTLSAIAYTPATTNPSGTRAIASLYAPTRTDGNSTTAITGGAINNTMVYANINGSSSCPASVTTVTGTASGTFATGEVVAAKCYYTTSSTFSLASATQFGSTISSPANTDALVFTGSQALANGTGNYFWILYDVSCAAVAANTVNATINSLTVGSTAYAISTGTVNANAINALYAPSRTDGNSTTAITGGAINNTMVYANINGSSSCPASVTTVTGTASGTFATGEVVAAKCYYTTSSTFSLASATQFGSTISSPANTDALVFTGSQALANGTGNYFWILYDVSCAAVAANTVNATINSLTVGSTAYAISTGTVNANAINALYAPSRTDGNSTTAITGGAINNTMVYANINGSSSCPASVTTVTGTASGTFATGEVVAAKCYYTTSSTFSLASATQFGSTISSPANTDALVFTGSQALANGTGNYFWILYDVSCTAVAANTVNATINSLTVGSTVYTISTGTISANAINALYVPTRTDGNGTTAIPAGTVNAAMVYAAISGASSCPSNVTTVTGAASGTFAAGDIVSAKCYYTTTTTFSVATPYGSPISAPASGGALVFTGSQALASGTGNYFWIVYDLSCGAVVANTVNATINSLTVGSTVYSISTGTISANAISAASATTYNSIADGDWNNTATWACGTIPPTTCASTNTININNNITVTTAGMLAPNVTIATGASLTVSGGDLTLGCSSASGATGGSNKLLTVNGTLTINGGTLNVNGAVSMAATAVFNMSSGTMNLDPNDGTAAGSSTASNGGFYIQTPNLNLTGGNINFLDPMYTTSAGSGQAVLGYSHGSIDVSTGATVFTFGGGDDQNPLNVNGFYVEGNLTTGTMEIGNAVVAGGRFAAQRELTTRQGSTIYITKFKNLTVNPGAEVVMTAGSAPLSITGNLINNGVITNAAASTVSGFLFADAQYSSGVVINPLNTAQSISGTGFFKKSTADPDPTAQTGNIMGAMAVYHLITSPGLTLNMPITVSADLSLVRGKVNTTSANMLALGHGTSLPGNAAVLTATTGILDTYSASPTTPASYTGGFVVGPFNRWVTATTTSGQQGLMPVGSDTSRVAQISFTAAPTTGGYLTASWTDGTGTSPVSPTLNQAGVTPPTITMATIAKWDIVNAGTLTGGTYTASMNNKRANAVLSYANTVLLKRATGATGSAWEDDGAGGPIGVHVTSTGSNTSVTAGRSGLTTFSSFAIGGGVAVLPISLEYFTGRKQAAVNILDWKVNSSSASTLTLERSTDRVNYKTINVQTASIDRMLNPFTYTDAAPAAGVNYYRLKITNADGESKYSNVVALINKDKGFELISMAPNPVQHSTVLNLSSAKAGKMELSVSDVTGKVVMKQSVSVIAGNNPITLNFATFAAGTYQITAINADGDSKSTRFVKF